MDNLILIFCSLISCIIITNILFQFWNDRFKKAYRNRYIYLALPIGMILMVMAVNLFMNPVLNFVINIILVGIISCFFYYNDSDNRLILVIESEVLLFIMAILESFGVFLIKSILNFFNIMPESIAIQQSIETAFSKLILLFLYYVVFGRMWKKGVTLTVTQYVLYVIMFSYSVANIIALSAISKQENSPVLLITAGFIVFVNMFLLHFIKYTDERNYYKSKADMMEQQVELQFSFYQDQSDKYDETRAILHDIDKHIKVIETLYQEGQKKEAFDYTQKIKDMLRPLTPYKYTSNPILNCLLSDKTQLTDRLGIDFIINLKGVDLNFMTPMDITTLLGNLIDNAVNACKRCKEHRIIVLEIRKVYEMVSISIKNRVCEEIKIKNNIVINKNKDHRGIGMMNIQKCVERYEGSIIYKVDENLLTCHIVLNMPGE